MRISTLSAKAEGVALTVSFVVYLVLGAMAGGFINGLAGMGTALFALGFYLVVLEPVTAVATVALMSVIAGVQGVWIVRREALAKPLRWVRFVIPGVIGVPVGLLLLGSLEGGSLRIGIAVMLVIYGGYFGFRKALPAVSRDTPLVDTCVGFIGGLMGGAASVSGAVPTIWLSMRPWPKAEMRAVLQPFNMVILTTTIVLLAFRGAYDQTAVTALLITVPVGLIAAQVGIMVFRRLSDTGFRRLLIWLCLLMGLGIGISEIL